MLCSHCKFLTDVNRDVAPDRGWCPVWENWQKTRAKSCVHFSQKEYTAKYQRREGNSRRDL